MVVVLIFKEQMGDTRYGYTVLRLVYHPRVGFANQNNLCEDLLVENVSYEGVPEGGGHVPSQCQEGDAAHRQSFIEGAIEKVRREEKKWTKAKKVKIG
jgi:hypothetical protein